MLVSCAALALAIPITGCGDDDKDAAAQKPTTFAVTATAEGSKKKALEFPATVKSGLVALTLKNSYTVPRSAQLIRVTGDQTVDDVLKIVNAEDTKIPDFMQDGGGTGAVKPGATAIATQNLAPGRYVIWDDEGGDEDDAPGNDALGAKGEFTVTGEASDAELPKVAATVTATDSGTDTKDDKEYGFEFTGPPRRAPTRCASRTPATSCTTHCSSRSSRARRSRTPRRPSRRSRRRPVRRPSTSRTPWGRPSSTAGSRENISL